MDQSVTYFSGSPSNGGGRWLESNGADQTKSALLGGLEGLTERWALFCCDVRSLCNLPPQNDNSASLPGLSIYPVVLLSSVLRHLLFPSPISLTERDNGVITRPARVMRMAVSVGNKVS